MAEAAMSEVGRVFNTEAKSDSIEIRQHCSEHPCHEQAAWNNPAPEAGANRQRYRHMSQNSWHGCRNDETPI